MSTHTFAQVIPTHIYLEHIHRLLSDVDGRIRRARGEDTLILQGRAVQLEELLHLPETLTILEEHEEAEAKRGKLVNGPISQLDHRDGVPNESAAT